MPHKRPLVDDFNQPTVSLEIDNQSDYAILTKKYKKISIFSNQRIFHPQERGLITQGDKWSDCFRIKIYSINEKLETKLLLKLTVNKMYRAVFTNKGHSVQTLKISDVDKQLCAYQRMEEVWDNSNYYETLRVKQDATQREIRIAYLKLAKIYHPDHNKHPHAQLMFERITEAYHTLSDEEVRKQYDTHLRTDPGILSKSYWRQIFCHWNKHKAIQVGISTLLVITGSVVILTSILAAPTGAGIIGTIIGTAIGSALFASGIGGISVAFSRQAALEGNTNYKRYLKYSFWYGLAGLATGAISGGVAGALGVAVGGGMAAVATSGVVNGAIQGLCFGIGSGIASDRWIHLIKKLRVDAIALDLIVSTLTGAATGAVFQAILMTTAGAPSAIMGHAKFSVEQLAGNHGGILLPQKTKRFLSSNNKKENLITNAATPLLLTNVADNENDNNCDNNDEIDHEDINDKNLDSDNFIGCYSSEENSNVLVNSHTFTSDDDEEAYFEDCDSDSELSDNYGEINQYLFSVDDSNKFMENQDGNCNENNNTVNEIEDLLNFVPPEIEEFLQCEENTVECINEAISLFEEVAHKMPSHFVQFYDFSRGKKVRMVVDYVVPKKSDNSMNFNENSDCNNSDLEIVKEYVSASDMYYIPDDAQFIQIHFEYSTVGLLWCPVCNFENLPQTFAYSEPLSRRFFIVGYSEETIHVSQVRDEYEQLVLE